MLITVEVWNEKFFDGKHAPSPFSDEDANVSISEGPKRISFLDWSYIRPITVRVHGRLDNPNGNYLDIFGGYRLTLVDGQQFIIIDEFENPFQNLLNIASQHVPATGFAEVCSGPTWPQLSRSSHSVQWVNKFVKW